MHHHGIASSFLATLSASTIHSATTHLPGVSAPNVVVPRGCLGVSDFLRPHTNMSHLFVHAVLLEGQRLSEQLLRSLVLEGIILEKVNVQDLFLFTHDAHGLVVRYLPLVNLSGNAFQIWLVGLLNQIEPVVRITEKEEELVRHQVRNVLPDIVLLFLEVIDQLLLPLQRLRLNEHLVLPTNHVLYQFPLLIVPLQIRNAVVHPHLEEGVRDVHIDQSETPLDLVIHHVQVVLLGLAAFQHECV